MAAHSNPACVISKVRSRRPFSQKATRGEMWYEEFPHQVETHRNAHPQMLPGGQIVSSPGSSISLGSNKTCSSQHKWPLVLAGLQHPFQCSFCLEHAIYLCNLLSFIACSKCTITPLCIRMEHTSKLCNKAYIVIVRVGLDTSNVFISSVVISLWHSFCHSLHNLIHEKKIP